MGKSVIPLTDLQIRKAKPRDKDYKLSDGGGLFLLVTVRGSKLWRVQYKFSGKSQLLACGSYPETSLALARERRRTARQLLAQGVSPALHKKAVLKSLTDAGADSFAVIAREWHVNQADRITRDHHKNLLTRLEKDVFPWVGAVSLREVTALQVKACLDRVKSRGTVETARRVRVIMSQVFQYAVATDRAIYDPAASLKGYLPPVSRTRKHYAAVTDPKELAPLLRAVDGYQGGLVAQCALKLLPLLLVRPGELRHAEWAEFDLDAACWNIPAVKMKMKEPHLVPLPSQAVTLLRELQLATRGSRYVFPSTRSTTRCMSDNTINAAFRRMGFDKEVVTGHGFRATARTILDEVLGVRVDCIEQQLAHVVRDPLGRAYNRTAHLEARRAMMQQWADYLEGLK